MEKGAFQDPTDAQKCADSLSLKWDLIQPCYTGLMGHNLELMYANETASLKPPHQYTPWITINGEVRRVKKKKKCIRICFTVYDVWLVCVGVPCVSSIVYMPRIACSVCAAM